MFILLQFDEIFMRDLFYLRLYLTNLIAKMQENKLFTWNRISFSSHRIIALYVNSIRSKPTFNMGRLLFFQWYFLFEFERSNRSFSSTGKLGPPSPAGFTKFVTFRLIELYPDCSTDEKQQRNKLPQRQYYKVKTEQKMRAQVTRKT